MQNSDLNKNEIDFKAIQQFQYVELINRITSIAQRLNEIESIIGGTKRKWRDDTDLRLTKLESVINSESGQEKCSICKCAVKTWITGDKTCCCAQYKPSPSTCEHEWDYDKDTHNKSFKCKLCGIVSVTEPTGFNKHLCSKPTPSISKEQQDLAVFIWESLSPHVGFYPVNAEKCNEIAREWFKRKVGNSKEEEVCICGSKAVCFAGGKFLCRDCFVSKPSISKEQEIEELAKDIVFYQRNAPMIGVSLAEHLILNMNYSKRKDG